MPRSHDPRWNDATQCYAPASTTAHGHDKGGPGAGSPGTSRPALAPLALLLGALLASAAGAQALPTGGQVVAGQANVHVNGPQMTITQTTPKAIVQWQGFDIGKQNQVEFKQPDASAIALNRVVGGNASQIDGQLRANGQVWLVNPNGVVFGNSSQVNVGGLVASTLDITNEDFDAGRQLFTRGAAQGGITNHGDITVARGGTLALLAPTVNNEGTLTAQLGNVMLAGGDQILLEAGAQGRLQVAVSPATVRTLVENNKLIMADGGQVVMTASAADALSASMVSNTGTVQARTLENQWGRILLLGDTIHGQVEHSGVLDASAPEGGSGGFVHTSAARLQVKEDAWITTAAPQGSTGLWESISTADTVIHAGRAPERASGIAADALTASLAHTHVDLHAQAPDAQKSHIHVDAGIRHDRHRLTLNASHDIDINARVSVEGTGTLHLNYGGTAGSAHAVAAAGSNLNVPSQGQVDFAQAGANLLSINGHGFEVIQDLATLQSMGDEGRLGGKYAMGRSIDAGGVDFAPIGTEKAFTGTFDGLGHAIDNLTIERVGQDAVGLFGRTTNATLRNLALVDGSVKGSDHVGGLVGVHQAIGGTASISHVRSTGQVAGEFAVGGLVGSNLAQNGTASISHVQSTGLVRGVSEDRALATGGLVGFNKSHSGTARIAHAHVTGSVWGDDCVGGLVGINQAIFGTASIASASATGRVWGDSSIGGLVGRNEVEFPPGTVDISHVLATGKVTGARFFGGLVGENQTGGSGVSRMVNARSTGVVTRAAH